MDAKSLSTVDTVYSADAIEFCPDNSLLFACGTYQIEKDESGVVLEEGEEKVAPTVRRYGRCLLYEIDQEGGSLREAQRFDGPAILDMKWSTSRWNDKKTLAIADAEGRVQLRGMDDATGLLSPTQIVECADDKTLCLSLDWSNRRAQAGPASIVVSLSNGSICTLGGETELSVTSTWEAHDFEPWIAAFDCWEPNTVWTGGDDCKLKGWDLRQGCEQPTFVNKRFEGGVTTIQSHPLLENLFAVGSYDAHVRIFDRRKPLVPLLDYDVGGGIWRLKWHASRSERLLVAAMHGGFRVVDFEGLGGSESVEPTTHAKFDGHESLAYGVDWSGGQTEKGEDVVASCSFYDHTVHVWSC